MDLFRGPGATVIVDGQFGSTGKGVAAEWLYTKYSGKYNIVTTNAGPNSGHTAYIDGQKVVTQQIPISSLRSASDVTAYLNAGAMIDVEILEDEIFNLGNLGLAPHTLRINPQAVRISTKALLEDRKLVNAISGTGKGTGPALGHKVARLHNAVMGDGPEHGSSSHWGYHRDYDAPWDWSKDIVVVETAQGFSLGYHSSFYPYTTSRECTVQQAIADARIPYNKVRDVIMVCRTFPIRVGNSSEESSSGGFYNDQIEMTWDELGQEPELTTVTQRVRRVFSWSRTQFRHALQVNQPTIVFINFMNYLKKNEIDTFLRHAREDIDDVVGSATRIILGWGPTSGEMEWHK